MKLRNISKFKWLMITVLLMSFFSCVKEQKEDVENKNTNVVKNQLIGNWRFDQKNGSYWYEMKFNADLSGTRIDADQENDNFTYTFSETEIHFTSGFPSGKFDYKVLRDSILIWDSDTLKKKL